MVKIHGSFKDWENKKWKSSFEKLKEEGYCYEKIELEGWFLKYLDGWKSAVLCRKFAQKKINETEKAIEFSVITQYGNEYEMWFPKKALVYY